MILRKEPGKFVLALVSFFFLFHLVLAAKAGLVADEAYYWIWSLHPRMSYFDHPPGIAWTIAAFTHLFGTNRLGIRMPALLISAAISFLLYKMGKEFLKDRWAGAWAVLFVTASLLFSAGAFIITPDSLVILFFALTLWQFYHALETGSGRSMMLSGLWFGLGLLSKYTMVLLGPLLLLFLLASPARRRWLARPSLWGAGILALILFTPVVLWNSEHDWASFRFQWHHGMEAHQYAPLSGLLDYLGGQFGVMTPLVYLILIAAAFWGLRESRRNPRRSRLLLLDHLLSHPFVLCLFEPQGQGRGELARGGLYRSFPGRRGHGLLLVLPAGSPATGRSGGRPRDPGQSCRGGPDLLAGHPH